MEKRKAEGVEGDNLVESEAIKLLVDNIHSIPVGFPLWCVDFPESLLYIVFR